MARLLVISSRARKANAGAGSLLPGVRLIRYSYESTGLEELTQLLLEQVRETRVLSVAILLNGSEKELFLCEDGAKKITLQTLISDKELRDLFELISRNVLVEEGGRVDFLGSYAADHVDGGLMARELQSLMQVPVGVHRNLVGGEVVVGQTKQMIGAQNITTGYKW